MLTLRDACGLCRALEAKGYIGPRLRRAAEGRDDGVVVRDPATGADHVVRTLAEAGALPAAGPHPHTCPHGGTPVTYPHDAPGCLDADVRPHPWCHPR